MPAFAPIIINDGAATPVAHTFNPVQINGNVAMFADRATGITVGFPLLTTSLSRPSKTSKLTKVRFKLVMPILETLGNNTVTGIVPSPTKAYDVTFDCSFLLPERCSLADRNNILAYAKNLLAHATPAALVTTNETIY